MTTAIATPLHLSLEPKQFYRKIESIFQEIAGFGSSELFARAFSSGIFQHLREDLKIQSLHLYDVLSGSPELLCTWGPYVADASEELELLLAQEADFPKLATTQRRFCGIVPLGEDKTMILIAFLEESLRDEGGYLTSVFSSIHYALVQQLRRIELQDVFDQARAIQMSLLPAEAPMFEGFDICAASVPAKHVGGDVFDFQWSHTRKLAISIADASGHGLPAALQARDVITGLRMGQICGAGISATMEKLNSIIHRSGLASRFVSVVFGELDAGGMFRYVNAGHLRPILLQRSRFQELSNGGMILGPFPDSIYEEGTVVLQPEDSLVMFTDGVTEHCAPDGIEFGKARLKEWMEDWRHGSARLAVEDLFARLKQFGAGRPLRDDATVLYVRRED